MNKKVRIRELDVLRGIAALNVIIFHYTTKFNLNFGHADHSNYDWYLGRYGVELFFMISGFVIFMSLQGNISTKTFAKKRFKRLYPEYWICVCLTFLVLSLAADPQLHQVSGPVFLLNLMMFQGIFNVKSVDGVYWTLIPELLFYTAIGALHYFGQLRRIKLFGAIWLTLMILNSLFKLPFGAYIFNLQYGMFFMAGILFYNLKNGRGGWQEHLLLVYSFVAALCAHHGLVALYVYLFIYLVFYLFVYGVLDKLNWKPLLFVGYISYPLYLIHQNVGFVVMRMLSRYITSNLTIIFFTLLFVMLLAWLIAATSRAALKMLQASR